MKTNSPFNSVVLNAGVILNEVKNLAFVRMLILLVLCSRGFAQNAGRSAGLIIEQSNSPRPSALGDAFSSVSGDIAALNFNPASLAGLTGSQLAFQRKQGIFDDSYNQLAFGS